MHQGGARRDRHAQLDATRAYTERQQPSAVGAGEPPQHRLQDATVGEIADVDLAVQPRDGLEPALTTLLVADAHGHFLVRSQPIAYAVDGEGLAAGQAKRARVLTGDVLQGQDS